MVCLFILNWTCKLPWNDFKGKTKAYVWLFQCICTCVYIYLPCNEQAILQTKSPTRTITGRGSTSKWESGSFSLSYMLCCSITSCTCWSRVIKFLLGNVTCDRLSIISLFALQRKYRECDDGGDTACSSILTILCQFCPCSQILTWFSLHLRGASLWCTVICDRKIYIF